MAAVTAGADAQALSAGSARLVDMEFAEFFRAEHKKLIRFVVAMGASGDQAAEIAQETFFKAIQSWDSIRSPRPWIRRVAANEFAHTRRAGGREIPQETLPEMQVTVSTALAVELGEEGRKVIAALNALPLKQREVMAWIIDGFGPAEIARELGVSPDSVRQNYAKARKNLSRFYGRRGKR